MRRCAIAIQICANIAASRFMENSAGSIAAIHATLRKGSVTAMPHEEFEREKMYQTTMCIFRSMLRKGPLTEEEYRKAERLMVKKYQPKIGTLFSDLTLT